MRRKDRQLHRSPATAPANQLPRPWAIRNAANGGVPVIKRFGDIGVSKAGDPWWGLEGGAGTFQEFAAELKKIGPVPELRVEIHSYGGSVTVGKGIHDKLLEHPANKTAVIYGICASAATYAALACDHIQIPANSFYLIHNSTGGCWGTAKDMGQCKSMLDVADESIAALYAAHTGKSIEEIRVIMDADTWMTGADAVEFGLATEVVEPITVDPEKRTAPENYRPALLNTMPEGARAWFDMSRISNAHRAFTPSTMQTTAPTPTNAATQPTAPAVSAAPTQPIAVAPVNTAPIAPVAPVEPVVPVNAAPSVPVAPAAPVAPVNAAPVITLTQEQLNGMITNAANAAVTAHVTNQAALAGHGITQQNLGGAQPVANVVPPEAPSAAATPRQSVVNALSKLPVFGSK